MEYRRLGRTGLAVSVLGIGGGYLMFLEPVLGTALYQRAFDLGLNYFDGRYGDSSAKLRPVLKGNRSRCIVGSKTAEASAEGVLKRVDEDLEMLDTDYLDIYYLRCYNQEMLQERLAPGGAFDGLIKAREMGKVRFIGLANHSDLAVHIAAIETGLVDVVTFPLNIVRREALEVLIPAAQKQDVGLVVMKPLSVGRIPAEIGLRWLANQPIHTMAPGICTLEQLEQDVAAVERQPAALSLEEEAEVARCRHEIDHFTCRICDQVCQAVCERKLPIDMMIHHDVMYEHYRNLGLEGFLDYPMAAWARKNAEAYFLKRLAAIQSCTRCARCEEVCPYGVRVMEMFDKMLVDHQVLIEAVREREWASLYEEAQAPFQSRRIK